MNVNTSHFIVIYFHYSGNDADFSSISSLISSLFISSGSYTCFWKSAICSFLNFLYSLLCLYWINKGQFSILWGYTLVFKYTSNKALIIPGMKRVWFSYNYTHSPTSITSKKALENQGLLSKLLTGIGHIATVHRM